MFISLDSPIIKFKCPHIVRAWTYRTVTTRGEVIAYRCGYFEVNADIDFCKKCSFYRQQQQLSLF